MILHHNKTGSFRNKIPGYLLLLQVVLLFGILPAAGQQVKLSSGSYLINKNAEILVNGNIVNAGKISNAGNLYITGDLSNIGTIKCNSGTFTFNGTSVQTISGTYSNTFNHVVVDNSIGVVLSSDSLTTVSGDLTINGGKKLTLSAGKQLTVSGTLTNNAGTSGFLLRSDTTGTASLIEITQNAPATVERFFPDRSKYHFLASPITNATANVFKNSWMYKWNETTQYYDNVTSLSDAIEVMRGYSVQCYRTGQTGKPNNPFVYSGNLNASGQGMFGNMSFTSGADPTLDGYNLVGNPYPSAIDWDAPIGWTKMNLDNSIYFWNGLTGTYGAYVGGMGGLGTNGATQYIGAQQGFFVRCLSAPGGTLQMDNDVRTHNSSSLFRSAPLNILRLMLVNNSISDETIIRFTPDATESFDGKYDAFKMFGYIESPQLYTYTADNQKASINSFPETKLDSTKVYMNIRIGSAGNCKITASDLNTFENTVHIELEDRKLNIKQDLIKNPEYSFYSDGVSLGTRFIVWFYQKPVSIINVKQNEISVYSQKNIIYVDLNGINSIRAEMTVLNMLGQTVLKKQLSSVQGSNYQTYLADGIYIARIQANGKIYEKKLFLSN